MRKLTRTEANFENLLEAALLVEGHCSHAAHGCSCRGCDECEENYMAEYEEGEKESLADLIDRYVEGKPNTKERYEGPNYLGDPRADDEEYDEEQEGPVETAIGILSRQKQIEAGPPEVKRLLAPAKKIVQDLTTSLSRGSYK
jgi:hypothetical protein